MNVFNKRQYLIANMGFNFHEIAQREDISDLEAAKLLIMEAKKAGVDAVKFYISSSENSFVDEDFEISNPQLLLNKYDTFNKEDYKKLADLCLMNDILFLAMPFDFESVDFSCLFTDIFCLSSADLTNTPFIKHIARKNKPIILYTGGSTLGEIKNAIKVIEDESTVDVILMHSVLSYPTDYLDTNLLMIKDLLDNFPGYKVGYCDHTKTDDNLLILTTAVSYGANIIEKYFTIDKSIKSNSHSYSMDSDDVLLFRANVAFLSKINGMKNKHPLICESSSIRQTRRSIVAKRDIKKGEIITAGDVTCKWPGYGISPNKLDDILGKKINCNVSKDTILNFEMFE